MVFEVGTKLASKLVLQKIQRTGAEGENFYEKE